MAYADGTYKFYDGPRPVRMPPEDSVSLMLGALEPHAARFAVNSAHDQCHRDASRHTRAGTLRARGFRVEHTPRLPGFPSHVSVYWDGDWDEDVRHAFRECFDEPRGGRHG